MQRTSKPYHCIREAASIVLLGSALSVAGADRPIAATPAAVRSTNQAAATDPAKTKEKELLALFESKSNITNTLGSVFIYLPSGIRVGRTEVTQTDYQAVMDSNPSKFQGGSMPVESVTPTQAMDFCRRLTEREQKAGKLPKNFAYALPTEAEFDVLTADTRLEIAVVSLVGDRQSPSPVASLAPNSIGLHDVRGNVWEWCDGAVARGSSYQSHEDYLEPGYRFVGDPETAYMDIGFRVILRSAGKP